MRLVYLALATAVCLCLIPACIDSQSNHATSYIKLTRAALRVAKLICHTELYEQSKACAEFQEAAGGFQTELLSIYTHGVNTDTAAGSTGGKYKNTDAASHNKHTNGKSTNNKDDNRKAAYFGNPGISYRR